MQQLCEVVIGECHSLGIEIVRGELDPDEYSEFLAVKKQRDEEEKLRKEQEMLEARKKLAKRFK